MPIFEGGQIQNIGSQLIQKLMSGTLVVFGIIILVAVIISVSLYVRWVRQFNIKVKIKSLRNPGTKGQMIYKIIEDKGAFIYKRRDKTRWFRLKNMRIDLPPPPLECLEMGAAGENFINILQKSDEEFYYLLPDKIDYDYVIKTKMGKHIEVPTSQVTMKIVEGDVSYWNQIRKRQDKKIFDTEGLLMKLLPYIIPMLMFALVIFMTYFITEKWGVFADAAKALKDAAEVLRDVSTAQSVPAS